MKFSSLLSIDVLIGDPIRVASKKKEKLSGNGERKNFGEKSRRERKRKELGEREDGNRRRETKGLIESLNDGGAEE